MRLKTSRKKIIEIYEGGSLKPVRLSRKKIEEIHNIAPATFVKKKNINIRVSERDLHRLKVKAAELGLPYQTLVSSVLHQYTNKQL